MPKRTRPSSGAFLWIVRRASEESYRKTAAAFFEMTGCAISHVTVMNCIHAERALIEAAPGASALKISQEEIFLEVDRLWVHLQEHTHRKKALARFPYEQARSTKSFELKIAAAYVGKRRVAPGRFARDGLALACSAGDADAF